MDGIQVAACRHAGPRPSWLDAGRRRWSHFIGPMTTILFTSPNGRETNRRPRLEALTPDLRVQTPAWHANAWIKQLPHVSYGGVADAPSAFCFARRLLLWWFTETLSAQDAGSASIPPSSLILALEFFLPRTRDGAVRVEVDSSDGRGAECGGAFAARNDGFRSGMVGQGAPRGGLGWPCYSD
jgi:hypothetical protein